MVVVPAQAALRKLLKPRGRLTAYRVAKELRTDPEAVSRWARGESRPSAHFRIALERLYGIVAALWMTPAERLIAYGVEPKAA